MIINQDQRTRDASAASRRCGDGGRGHPHWREARRHGLRREGRPGGGAVEAPAAGQRDPAASSGHVQLGSSRHRIAASATAKEACQAEPAVAAGWLCRAGIVIPSRRSTSVLELHPQQPSLASEPYLSPASCALQMLLLQRGNPVRIFTGDTEPVPNCLVLILSRCHSSAVQILSVLRHDERMFTSSVLISSLVLCACCWMQISRRYTVVEEQSNADATQ